MLWDLTNRCNAHSYSRGQQKLGNSFHTKEGLDVWHCLTTYNVDKINYIKHNCIYLKCLVGNRSSPILYTSTTSALIVLRYTAMQNLSHIMKNITSKSTPG